MMVIELLMVSVEENVFIIIHANIINDDKKPKFLLNNTLGENNIKLISYNNDYKDKKNISNIIVKNNIYKNSYYEWKPIKKEVHLYCVIKRYFE